MEQQREASYTAANPDVGDLQEKLAEKAIAGTKFGTFAGVFTPTILTILGVIMFLREGWVVGNAGLLGAWLIILLACGITLCTGLSMSSITTNIRIGAGGAFSIISQSLGLEVGGSVGVTLYFSQALAVAMYIFGFREGWLWIFPSHPALAVDLGTFFVIFLIGSLSASLAFRVQYLIMAVIVGSLISVLIAVFQGSMQYPVTWWGSFPGSAESGFEGVRFWTVFAVFFPAATGIMAGANMSGELKNPRKAIPDGTISAIAISTVIYMLLAYWLATSATTEELLNNYTVLIDKAAWKPIVIAGLLGATFSSALASLVGAPRILYALGEHRIVPGGHWFAHQTPQGEPRNSMYVTGAIVLAALLIRDLNAIAPLISLFFLITYAMINVVVLIEQSLELVSFRPTLKIPSIIPLLGAVGCLFAMFIQNPTFSLVAVAVVVMIYWVLLKRSLFAPFGEWAAKKVSDLPAAHERTWQPNLVVPIESPHELRGAYRFLYAVARPKGSLKILGMSTQGEQERLRERLPVLAATFRTSGLFASWAVMHSDNYGDGVISGMQALGGSYIPPNLVLLQLPDAGSERETEVRRIIERARENRLGVVLFAHHKSAGLGLEKSINLWISDRSPEWQIQMNLGNLDVCILIAYLIQRNWSCEWRLVTAVRDPQQLEACRSFHNRLIELTRIPRETKQHIAAGEFPAGLSAAPQADLNIFGMPAALDFDQMRAMVEQARSSCVFLMASGEESALA
jgi:solute carrier family 12 (sodium/potassium/chloride transporter), member 2